MPVVKKDPNSGALVFHLTPEEKALDAMQGRVEALENLVKELLKQNTEGVPK